VIFSLTVVELRRACGSKMVLQRASIKCHIEPMVMKFHQALTHEGCHSKSDNSWFGSNYPWQGCEAISVAKKQAGQVRLAACRLSCQALSRRCGGEGKVVHCPYSCQSYWQTDVPFMSVSHGSFHERKDHWIRSQSILALPELHPRCKITLLEICPNNPKQLCRML
jgi:hypothetical protein